MKRSMIALIGMAVAGIAAAKLPPPSEAEKAKAEEAKAKAAWNDKVAAYHLCLAQNRVVDYYHKHKGGAEVQSSNTSAAAPAAPSGNAPALAPTSAPAQSSGNASASAPASAAVPPCKDPGPYVASNPATSQTGVADAKPEPAAGKPQAPAEAKK